MDELMYYFESEGLKPLFSEEVRNTYERSKIPLIIYYATKTGFQVYLISDGFSTLYEAPKEELTERLNGPDPFVNIPEKDALMEVVRNFIKDDAPFNVIFHEYIGEHRKRLTVHAIGNHRYTEDGRRFSVVYYVEISDAEQRELFRDETKLHHMALNGLSRDYDVIWMIDRKDHSVTLLQNKQNVGVVQDAVEDAKKLGVYDVAVENLIRTRIVEEDREYLSKATAFDELERSVPENGVYTCNYKQYDDKGGIRYLQMCFTRAEWKGTQNFIVGIRNIENMIKKQLENQKKLEDALQKAEAATRAKSAFLFNVSHDIRTPLNAILGFADLARMKKDSDGKLDDYLQKIHHAGEHLLSILNEVLEMARIENNRLVITTELCDTSGFYEDCRMITEGEMKKKNLTCEISHNSQHSYLYFDREHMMEILINLLSNAIKYTPEGGKIRVASKEFPGDEPGTCIIETTVEDTGVGMSEEFVAHAFDAFERERTDTTVQIAGTGLGLAIVRRLVDLMGGTIRIESKLGVGTKVIFRIPHAYGDKPSATKKDDNKDALSLLAGKHILLVEDNELNAEIAQELLTDRGFKVDLAENGAVCLEKYASAPAGTYDVILMDVQMPIMDGYTTTKRIRELDAKRAMIPIVAMTANAFKEDVEKAMAAGMDRHVAKPIDIKKLEEALISVLK